VTFSGSGLEDTYTDIPVQKVTVSTDLTLAPPKGFFGYLVTNPVPIVPIYIVKVL